LFTLKNLNVVRIVETERQKAILISKGFKELKEEVKKVTKRGKE